MTERTDALLYGVVKDTGDLITAIPLTYVRIDGSTPITGGQQINGNLLVLGDIYGYSPDTGWPRDSNITLSFDPVLRTFTVTAVAGNMVYFIDGERFSLAGPETVDITNTEGTWFIYFEGSTLTASQTAWTFNEDKAFVSSFYWDAVNGEVVGGLLPEYHSFSFTDAIHKWGHETFGTRWESGLDVTLNGTTTLAVASGEIHDEDLEATIGSDIWTQTLNPLLARALYRDGAAGLWRQEVASTAPVILTSNVLQYNEWTGATWQLTDVAVNRYCAYWVIASTAQGGEGVFLVPGQEDGATLRDARDGNALADMAFGSLPTQEHKVIARVIVQRRVASPYYDLIEVADYRNSVDEPKGTGAAAPVAHADTTGQTADDHHTEDHAGDKHTDRSYLCYANNSTQNINGAAAVAINWQVPMVTVGGTDISWSSGAASRITINTTGTYRIDGLVYMTSLLQRGAPLIQVYINGSLLAPVGASGYIRSISGHNESSCHINGLLQDLTAGDYIELKGKQGALAGAVNTSARTSYITVERIA